MGRGTALGVAVCVGALLLAWAGRTRIDGTSAAGAAEAGRAVAYAPSRPVGEESARTAAIRARRVRQACDLDVATRCRGEVCVGVMVAPDPDAPGGWVRLAARSPRFVASTVARDLGVPPGTLPCGAAIASLVGLGGVIAIDRADGTEAWCAAGGTDAGRALCAEAVGAAVDSARIRRFDR